MRTKSPKQLVQNNDLIIILQITSPLSGDDKYSLATKRVRLAYNGTTLCIYEVASTFVLARPSNVDSGNRRTRRLVSYVFLHGKLITGI